MLTWLRIRIGALNFWLKDMFMFWGPVERKTYTVECPEGHKTVMEREQVLSIPYTEAQVDAIDWDAITPRVVRISYTRCPHSECQALAKHYRTSIQKLA